MYDIDIDRHDLYDEFTFPPLSEFVGAMLAHAEIEDDGSTDIYLDKLSIKLPVELQILESPATGSDGLSLRIAAPTQRTVTSIYPVLHNIRLTVGAKRQ